MLDLTRALAHEPTRIYVVKYELRIITFLVSLTVYLELIDALTTTTTTNNNNKKLTNLYT